LLKGQNKDSINIDNSLNHKYAKISYMDTNIIVPDWEKFNVSGFVDAYYSYDFSEPSDHQKPSFFYNHTRHNEFSLNLALVQFNYQNKKTRGSVGLMTGTYPQYNLAHEQELMRNIYEAYGGVELMNDLWLDAGVFGSHLGFESAISSDNITLTRSIMAENSPYYLSGVKLTYTGIEKWTFLGIVSNGWQNISDLDNNKAIGTQVIYEPNSKLTLNYSTMFNKEEKLSYSNLYGTSFSFAPTKQNVNRFFNDIYVIIEPINKIKLIAAFDYGIQEGVSFYEWETWYAPAVLISYEWTDKFVSGLRAEYYSDKRGVITQPNFEVFGTSLNLDYKASKNAVLRIEGKWLYSEDKIFKRSNNTLHSDNVAITTSLAITFGK